MWVNLHVFVLHDMRQADLLRLRVELGALTPDEGVPEVRGDGAMDAMTDVLKESKG